MGLGLRGAGEGGALGVGAVGGGGPGAADGEARDEGRAAQESRAASQNGGVRHGDAFRGEGTGVGMTTPQGRDGTLCHVTEVTPPESSPSSASARFADDETHYRSVAS